MARWWTPGDAAGIPPAFLVAALCNDAQQDADHRTVGDPVDVALLEAVQAGGGDASGWRKGLPRVGEWPFGARRKRYGHHAWVGDPPLVPELGNAPYVVFVKGAPEAVVPTYTRWWTPGGPEGLGEGERAAVNA
ncbi:MAG: hypothetical protein N0A24_08245 [Armatimonadetes bacterium]|nr:hypothetical protein [Armatimonadota bacterium]MDW8154184.1 hypothetical protein [Armatimonadota bacterium]